MLSSPLRDRFGMHFRMQFYDTDELATIIKQAGSKLKKRVNDDAAYEIAKRSRGTPRIALRLLRRVRDFADVENEEIITKARSNYALDELGVNHLGFDELDIKFLDLLIAAKNRPMGLGTISAALSEDEGTIEDVIEPYLLANGYIERTARGRVATPKSYEYFKLGGSGGLFE
jgi:Holliday junction DNA helicase RuvB